MEGRVEVYCGRGKGKTSCAIGHCIKAAGQAKQVIVVQFLKGKDTEEISFIRRLEPEVQLFRFEKYEKHYMDLNEEEKKDQDHFIFNGLKYAQKVIDTRQCDVLVLDEVLGLLDLEIIKPKDLIELLESRDEELTVIMTGRSLPEELIDYVDGVYCIDTIKESE
jgi:cob(I)alamin adenosyltransferase